MRIVLKTAVPLGASVMSESSSRRNVPPGAARLVQQLSLLGPQSELPGPTPLQLGAAVVGGGMALVVSPEVAAAPELTRPPELATAPEEALVDPLVTTTDGHAWVHWPA